MSGAEENCHGKLVLLDLALIFAIELKSRWVWVCSDQSLALFEYSTQYALVNQSMVNGIPRFKKECLKVINHSELNILCKNKGAFLWVLVL